MRNLMTAFVCCISLFAAAQNIGETIAAGKKDKITVYVAKTDAFAYAEPSTSSEHQEWNDMVEGCSTLLASHNNNWYRHTDGDGESYYKKSDFATKVYDCADGISASYIKKNTPMYFVSEDCDVLTIFELQKMGKKVNLDPAFLTISDPEHLFMIKRSGGTPLLLPSSKDAIDISAPLVMLTEEKGNMELTEDFVHNQRLFMDANLVSMSPEDGMKCKYLPNEDAMLMNGAVYKRIKFSGYDKLAFELKGKVKTVSYITGAAKMNYEFDQEGNLLRAWSGNNKYYIVHDCVCIDEDMKVMGMSLIVGSDEAVTTDEYVVDAQNKRLYNVSGTDGGESYEDTCDYDAKGKLKSFSSTSYSDDEEEESTTEVIPVTTIASDSFGNWTKRKVGKNVETRTITYYE